MSRDSEPTGHAGPGPARAQGRLPGTSGPSPARETQAGPDTDTESGTGTDAATRTAGSPAPTPSTTPGTSTPRPAREPSPARNTHSGPGTGTGTDLATSTPRPARHTRTRPETGTGTDLGAGTDIDTGTARRRAPAGGSAATGIGEGSAALAAASGGGAPGVSDVGGGARGDTPASQGARPTAAPGEAPHADAELLDRVVGAALARIDGMRASFRLPADAATDANPNTTLKPLGELAELADVVRALHPLPAVRALAEDLFGFAWKETRGGELFAELVRGEPQATYPVEIYGVFARAGLRNPAVDELLAATTGLRLWQVAREDHTRTLNVLNAERRIGLPRHADFAAVLEMTGLGRRPEPWALDRRTAYGVTHDAFHVTDWGRTRDAMPEPLAAYLRLWLPAWTASWLEERQWDLAGELLAVNACVPGTPYDPVAWREFASAQRPDGAVPEVGDGPPEGASAQDEFIGCYHSTLVAAFSATLARTAPAPPAGTAHVPIPAESEVLP